MKINDFYPPNTLRVFSYDKVECYFSGQLTASGKRPGVSPTWTGGVNFHILPSASEFVVKYGEAPSQVVKLKTSGGFFHIPEASLKPYPGQMAFTRLGPLTVDFRNIRKYFVYKTTWGVTINQMPFLQSFGIGEPISGEIRLHFDKNAWKEISNLIHNPDISETYVKESRCGYCDSLKAPEVNSQHLECPFCLAALGLVLRTTRSLLQHQSYQMEARAFLIAQGAFFAHALRELSPVLNQDILTECDALKDAILQEFPALRASYDLAKGITIDSHELNRFVEYAQLLLLDENALAGKQVLFHNGTVLYPEAKILAELAVLGKCDIRELSTIGQFEISNGFRASNNHVVELKFNKTDLRYLPEDIHGLIYVEKLELENLQAPTLPDWFGDLPLKELNLNFTRFQEFPPVLTRLKTLEKLEMNTTSTPLPENFGELTGLKHLGCGYKHLEMLPDSIGQLIHLRDLFLHGSAIIQLTPAFANLQELEEVWLTNNQLIALPEFLVKLKALKRLYLQGNPLCENPDKDTQSVIKVLEKQGTHVILRNKK